MHIFFGVFHAKEFLLNPRNGCYKSPIFCQISEPSCGGGGADQDEKRRQAEQDGHMEQLQQPQKISAIRYSQIIQRVKINIYEPSCKLDV